MPVRVSFITQRRSAIALGVLLGVSVVCALALSLVGDRAGRRAQGQEVATDPLAAGHLLISRDGQPFFWLGDTAWLLAQRTTRDDVDLYLTTRAGQGVTVIQATAIMANTFLSSGATWPNLYGDLPVEDGDLSRPRTSPGNDPADAAQYDYWDHLDYVIDRAGSLGVTVALLPIFVSFTNEGYEVLTTETAYPYGRFLGERYRASANIIWVLGGDNTPSKPEHKTIWQEVARGITEGTTGGIEDYTATTMTYHISGPRTSGDYFHNEPWLDANMSQPGGLMNDTHKMVTKDYQRTPVKPAIMGEGAYEDGPGYGFPVDAHAIRKQIYWSYMSGAYFTYGNTNTWNFGTHPTEVTADWKAALNSPGALCLTIAKEILTSINWFTYVPDQSIFARGEVGPFQAINTAMRSIVGDGLFIYLATATNVSIHMDKITAAPSATATWINPATGERVAAGTFSTTGNQAFATPDGWQDALLLITP